jgi:LysM repeat protein
MAEVEGFATGTSNAMTAQAANGPTNTPGGPTPIGGTPITPITQVTFTPTPIIVGGATLTPTVTAIVVGGGTVTPSGSSITPTLITNRPATYTLQPNEFVYCIARRFDVDPDEILALNGIFDSETIYPGMVLKIPQSGSFPGPRALRAHPTTYTVTGQQDTNIYGVACKFGDVDPARIVQVNPGLSLGSVLTIGQTVSIP